MIYLRGKSKSPSYIHHFSNSFSLRYLICQGGIFWVVYLEFCHLSQFKSYTYLYNHLLNVFLTHSTVSFLVTRTMGASTAESPSQCLAKNYTWQYIFVEWMKSAIKHSWLLFSANLIPYGLIELLELLFSVPTHSMQASPKLACSRIEKSPAFFLSNN